MEEEKIEILKPEFSFAAFDSQEKWDALKEELATQYTPEDGDEDGENC